MATIPFASVEEVERRLGYDLDEAETVKLQIFLEELSLLLETLFIQKNKDIDAINPKLLSLIVARRGATYMLTAELLPGQTSFSETVADRSISGSFSGSGPSDLEFSKEELGWLGLGNSRSIYSIEMISEAEARRRAHGYL